MWIFYAGSLYLSITFPMELNFKKSWDLDQDKFFMIFKQNIQL